MNSKTIELVVAVLQTSFVKTKRNCSGFSLVRKGVISCSAKVILEYP